MMVLVVSDSPWCPKVVIPEGGHLHEDNNPEFIPRSHEKHLMRSAPVSESGCPGKMRFHAECNPIWDTGSEGSHEISAVETSAATVGSPLPGGAQRDAGDNAKNPIAVKQTISGRNSLIQPLFYRFGERKHGAGETLCKPF